MTNKLKYFTYTIDKGGCYSVLAYTRIEADMRIVELVGGRDIEFVDENKDYADGVNYSPWRDI